MTAHSIMIAEPDLIVAKSMERWLRNRGQSVTAIATTGNAILKEAEENRPDLALVNMNLKDGMSGIDVARTLIDCLDVPTVIIAAFADDILDGGYPDGDMYGYLIKPFSEKNLHLAIGMAMARHRKEHEIRRACECLKAVIATIDDAVIVTDTGNRITLMNHEAERLTGYEAGEVLKAEISSVFRPIKVAAGNSLSAASVGIVQGTNASGCRETECLESKSGERHTISHSVSPVRNSAHREIGFLHMFRDISPVLDAEKKYLKEQQLASLGVLAGGLAHDLNNILTNLVGYLSLSRMSVTAEPGIAYLDELEKNLFRIKDVAHQLLTFSPGGIPIRRVVQVQSVISRAVNAALMPLKIHVCLNLPDDLWPVEIDETQVVLSIRNLIQNASEAMHGDGQIQITGSNRAIWEGGKHDKSPRRFVKISVSDHGVGIGKEQLEKIFDPYVTTKAGSSGIGLTVVHSVIERHGGQVLVESDPGMGSTFHLLLPAAQHQDLC